MGALRSDNPEARRLQEEETRKHVPDPAERRHLKRSVGRYVEVVYGSNGGGGAATGEPDGAAPVPSEGRAVAVTADGYFLTAEHVVEDRPFFMIEFRVKRLPPTPVFRAEDYDLYFEKKEHRGRLVWRDPELDLAIVKFDFDGVPHIAEMRSPAALDELVYTADDGGGTVGLPPPDESGAVDFADRVGNGDFFSAGRVIARRRLDGTPPGGVELVASLISRGAMSGAPLVGGDGALCGIITEVWGQWRGLLAWVETDYFTRATMVDPQFIMAKIEADRRGR